MTSEPLGPDTEGGTRAFGGGLFFPCAQRGPARTAPRELARLIIAAWGDQYIDDLLSLTIPALLAPGNLPAFAESFDCELVLVVESRSFRTILRSPVIRALLRHCGLRLLPIDDLLAGPYGVVLTFALMRGFADLGEAASETHLMFLNADFIVADGSYRRLAEVIRNGARLAVAPSYCVVHEDVAGPLLRHHDETSQHIAVSPRELAATIIAHRHNTIRAKTVNQQLFRTRHYDQFYWSVDDSTLLARQLPISIIYMRPERVLAELSTFWDYGAVTEFCPSAKPVVLGDSDDFLIAELRSRATFKAFLDLGWPSIEEIAADWATFMVQDHLDYGRYPLVVHSHDLPARTEAAKQKLAAFVDAVYRAVPRPVDKLGHPFWESAYPHFVSANAENTRQIGAVRSFIDELGRELRGSSGTLDPTRVAAYGVPAPAPVKPSPSSFIGKVYHAIFGSLPFTKAWHPYHASLMAVLHARRPAAAGERTLFVRSETGLSFLFFDSHSPAACEITSVTAIKGAFAEQIGTFEFCFCQLNFEDLLEAARIFEGIRPRIRNGGKVVLFYFNEELRPLGELTYWLAARAFPLSGTSDITLSGSRPAALALRTFRWTVARYRKLPLGRLLFAAVLIITSMLGRLSTLIEERRNTRKRPQPCTSITIEINV